MRRKHRVLPQRKSNRQCWRQPLQLRQRQRFQIQIVQKPQDNLLGLRSDGRYYFLRLCLWRWLVHQLFPIAAFLDAGAYQADF
jgi:hypothetical protein